MRKLSFIISVVIIIIFSFFAASRYKKEVLQTSANRKVIVTTTLFPLYDMVKNIGQDHVDVTLLLPPGIEAHDFDPKPNDIMHINQSDIFVFTGKFMEPWVEDIVRQTAGKKLSVVDSSTGIKLITDSEDAHALENFDPHIWLDFANTQIMVDNITRALIEKDSAHAGLYQLNAENYKAQLTNIDAAYKNTLSRCAHKEIIYGGHYAFGYLSQRYGISYASIYGLSPDSEPSAQDIVQLIERIKKDGVRYIFSEEMLNPKITETIAQETNTQILALNPAHNISREEFQDRKNFFDIMQNNLTNLSIGLDCKK